MSRKTVLEEARGTRKAKPRHVDEFIDDMGSPAYAVWVFLYFRLPALLQTKVEPFMREKHLFCTYEDQRYRVTGASRLGDVWLATDFKRDVGYDLRVDVDKCSDWRPVP